MVPGLTLGPAEFYAAGGGGAHEPALHFDRQQIAATFPALECVTVCRRSLKEYLSKPYRPPGDVAPSLDRGREEEKLARDLYNVLYARWGSALFYNVALSERRHLGSLIGLLDLYGLDDPACLPMRHLVEALPQALELVSANVTDKAPNAIHATYDVATGIVSIPQLRVGSLAVASLEDRIYALTLVRVAGSVSPQLFSVAELRVVE